MSYLRSKYLPFRKLKQINQKPGKANKIRKFQNLEKRFFNEFKFVAAKTNFPKINKSNKTNDFRKNHCLIVENLENYLIKFNHKFSPDNLSKFYENTRYKQ